MKKNSYSYDDLITCGNGELFGPGNAKLPLPPMLMFDRITEINDNNGAFNKGSLKAELDIKNDLWFFDCHFKSDPVMPGCLGLDAMWQLVGFYLGWLGNPGKGRALGVGTVKFTGEVLQGIKNDLWFFDCHFKKDPVMPGCLGLDAMWQLVGFFLGWQGNPGKGRALGVGTVKFTGEVLQTVKNVRYEIDMKKIMSPGGTTVGLANGVVLADEKKIYSADGLKVGLFR